MATTTYIDRGGAQREESGAGATKTTYIDRGAAQRQETAAATYLGPSRELNVAHQRPYTHYAARVNGLALFMAAGSAMLIAGPLLQDAQAYARADPQVRLPAPNVIPPAPAQIAFAPNQRAAYVRPEPQPQWWPVELAGVLGPTQPTFARYIGPAVQQVAAYARPDPYVRVPPPLALPPAVPVAPYVAPYGAASYLRPDPAVRARGPWFALFAPANPTYVYAGPLLQPSAAYARVDALARLLPSLALPATPAFTPAPQAQPPSLYARDAWATRVPAAQITASADALPYVGFSSATAYLRDARASVVRQSITLPSSVDPVPYVAPAIPALLPTPADARREWLPLEPWFGQFASAGPVAIYPGPQLQRATAYDRAWPILPPAVFGIAPLQPVAAFVFSNPAPQIAREQRAYAPPAAPWAAIDASIPAFVYGSTRVQQPSREAVFQLSPRPSWAALDYSAPAFVFSAPVPQWRREASVVPLSASAYPIPTPAAAVPFSGFRADAAYGRDRALQRQPSLAILQAPAELTPYRAPARLAIELEARYTWTRPWFAPHAEPPPPETPLVSDPRFIIHESTHDFTADETHHDFTADRPFRG